MNKAIYEDKEREISIRDLFWYVCAKWKNIVLVMIVCALIGLGVSVIAPQGENVSGELPESGSQTASESEQLAERKAALEESWAGLEEKIAAEKTYMEESLLMQIDPYNVYTAEGFLVFQADRSLTSAEESLLSEQYQAVLDDQAFLNQAADKIGSEAKYVKELLSLSSPAQLSEQLKITDTAGNMMDTVVSDEEENSGSLYFLKLSVIAPDQATADTLYTEAGEVLAQTSPSGISAACTVEMTERTESVSVDRSLKDRQTAVFTGINSLEDNLTKTKTLYDGVEVPEPVQTEMDGRAFSLKYVALGAGAGFVLIILFWIARYLLSERIKTADELQEYYGIRALGKLGLSYEKTKKSRIDRFLLAKRNGGVVTQTEKQMDLITGRILLCCGSEDKILLTGTVGEEKLQSAAEALQKAFSRRGVTKEICTAQNLAQNPDGGQLLTSCGGVVLLEERDVTKYHALEEEICLIADGGKELLGVILLV